MKRIQRVRPAAFCSRDFSLLHDNAPAHKACQFLTQKNVTTLYHPLYSPDLSPPDCFLFPKLKMKLRGLYFADVAEIQEAVTDELKNAQKEAFSAAFQKVSTAQKPLYMQMELILYRKNLCVFLSCLRFKKKISPKTFGPQCVRRPGWIQKLMSSQIW